VAPTISGLANGATLKAMPIAITHTIWMKWKPAQPTSFATVQAVSVTMLRRDYVCNMLVHTSKNFL
jgi:hypothetical protein